MPIYFRPFYRGSNHPQTGADPDDSSDQPGFPNVAQRVLRRSAGAELALSAFGRCHYWGVSVDGKHVIWSLVYGTIQYLDLIQVSYITLAEYMFFSVFFWWFCFEAFKYITRDHKQTELGRFMVVQSYGRWGWEPYCLKPLGPIIRTSRRLHVKTQHQSLRLIFFWIISSLTWYTCLEFHELYSELIQLVISCHI